MVRMTANPSLNLPQTPAAVLIGKTEVNELDIDAFVTAEQTPKPESRRGWRRRRIRRGKS